MGSKEDDLWGDVPPHILSRRPGGARDEIRFEPPDIWKVKHVGPKQELPGCN